MEKDNIITLLVIAFLLTGSIYLSSLQKNQNPLSQFQKWKIKHKITYTSQFENSYREKLFLERKAIIEAHNSDPLNTYKRGFNKFSALTEDEFRQTYLTLKTKRSFKSSQVQIMEDNLEIGEIDWRKQGYVTPIKDQGHCGSCYAFSTTGGLQGLHKKVTGDLVSFSEQQLIDCDPINDGCGGGFMRISLIYVRQNGIVLQSEYPYTGVSGKCLKPKGSFKISGYTNLTNCIELANALTVQPIIVGVDSTNWSDYESGIFNGCPVDRDQFNHGVLLVGMTRQFWIIKNQWTTQWGENGYMRMKRGNHCNICNDGMLLHK